MQTSQVDTQTSVGFTVGSVLNRTFATLMKKPALFFGLTLGALLPSTALELALPAYSDTTGLMLASGILQMVCLLVSQGAVAFAVYRIHRGEATFLGEALSRGLARFLPLLLASLLTSFGIALGSMAIIPGLVLMALWVATIPACVVERLSATASIQRSMDLTTGYRLRVFGLVLLVFVVNGVIAFATGFFAATFGGHMVISLAMPLILALPQAFTSVMNACIYYDLRRIKEGVSMESLAGVFD